jgi:hypothetical protein
VPLEQGLGRVSRQQVLQLACDPGPVSFAARGVEVEAAGPFGIPARADQDEFGAPDVEQAQVLGGEAPAVEFALKLLREVGLLGLGEARAPGLPRGS